MKPVCGMISRNHSAGALGRRGLGAAVTDPGTKEPGALNTALQQGMRPNVT